MLVYYCKGKMDFVLLRPHKRLCIEVTYVIKPSAKHRTN